jgi:protein-tyrosine phosphatase
MNYAIPLSVVGGGLIAVGTSGNAWLLPIAWLGGNFLAVGIAHAAGFPRIMGKRRDGTIAPWGWAVFLPLLLYTTTLWHILRRQTREPATNVVFDDLVIGRRLLPSEVAHQFDNYVDLMAEFAESVDIRKQRGYISFPILDGGTPTLHELRETIGRLQRGRTYVHCTQGRGRTGLFALALLLFRGEVDTVEEGLRVLQAARPGIRLNRSQRRFLRRFIADED